jgi:hypothetical protein
VPLNIPGQPGFRDEALRRLLLYLNGKGPWSPEQNVAGRRNMGGGRAPAGVVPAEVVRRAMGDGLTQITGRPVYPSAQNTPAAISGAAAGVPTANAFRPVRAPFSDAGYEPVGLARGPRRLV